MRGSHPNGLVDERGRPARPPTVVGLRLARVAVELCQPSRESESPPLSGEGLELHQPPLEGDLDAFVARLTNGGAR